MANIVIDKRDIHINRFLIFPRKGTMWILLITTQNLCFRGEIKISIHIPPDKALFTTAKYY